MQYTTDFYIFSIITVLLLLITLIIIYKSRSIVNMLFIITPILFSAILIFNIFEELGTEVPNFFLWFPYILAPLGILFAGWYIHFGKEIKYQRRYLLFTLVYILFAFLSAVFLQLSTTEEPYLIGINHLVIIIPLLIAGYEYFKLRDVIPDQKNKILTLFLGLLIVGIGSFLRSISYFTILEDSVVALIIIIGGTFIVMISFLLQTPKSS